MIIYVQLVIYRRPQETQRMNPNKAAEFRTFLRLSSYR
jgi:hypothetical protein